MITGPVENGIDAAFRKQPAPYQTAVDCAEVFEQLGLERLHRTAPIHALSCTLGSPRNARSS
jgi:hypothetical protein